MRDGAAGPSRYVTARRVAAIRYSGDSHYVVWFLRGRRFLSHQALRSPRCAGDAKSRRAAEANATANRSRIDTAGLGAVHNARSVRLSAPAIRTGIHGSP